MNKNSSRSRNRGSRGRSRKRNHYRGNRGRSNGRKRNRFSGSNISHDKFINKNPSTQVIEEYEPKHSFDEFGLHSHIVDNLLKRGFTRPTRIQDESIPHILAGRDVTGLANTGSGKTAAFLLPLIHKLKKHGRQERALIVTPTRELAQQIRQEFMKFTDGMRLYSVLCVGGLGKWPQVKQLRRNPHVVIGTPGRLKDLMDQGEIKLDKTRTFILDEADRMLDMGFLPDINYMVEKLPQKRQMLCFGATVTPKVSKLIKKMLTDPITISVRTSETGEHIAQDIIKAASKDEKMNHLVTMLKRDDFEKVLIFGEMKHSVQRLADSLSKMGFPATAIHGNKSQKQRQRVLDSFKKGRKDILVATDVAARGLDIPNVSHVINFDIPQTHEDYIHRIGRTGRAGNPGQAYTFVS